MEENFSPVSPEMYEEKQTEEKPIKTAADRLRETVNMPDFGIPEIQTNDEIFKEAPTPLPLDIAHKLVDGAKIREGVGEQTAVAIENALTGIGAFGDQATLAFGQITSAVTGNTIAEDFMDTAVKNLEMRMEDMKYAEDSVGGIRNLIAQLAGGTVSMGELLLVSAATGGMGGYVQMGVQAFGEGAFNDMEKYKEEHGGSLKGYQPKNLDIAINAGNAFLQAVIEKKFGVSSPRFLTGLSRGLVAEGASGFLQESTQSALADLAEYIKGNKEVEGWLDDAEGWIRDGIVGAILQGGLGAATYNYAHNNAVKFYAKARAQAQGRETPNNEDTTFGKNIVNAKERGYASALTQEFKSAFDASTGEGQLQAKIASALKKAAETKELDLDTANETEMAQRIESIATQETMNAMDLAREQNRAISDLELNNIVYKDKAIWLEGFTPEVGDKAVDYARVLAERQSGLAEVNSKLDAINSEIKQLKTDLAQAQQEKQESRAKVLQARIDKQNALVEKNRVRAEKLETQTAKLEKQIAKQMAETPKVEEVVVEPVKAPVAESVVAKPVVEKPAVKEPVKMAEVKTKKEKPVAERKALKQERIIKNKEQEVKRAEPDSGLVMLNKEQAQQLLKDYQDLLAYKDVDVKKIKDKNEKAKAESAKSRLRDIEYNIEYIKYYAGEESTYQPKDVAEVMAKWKAESPTQQQTETQTELTKSKKRVKESAEVYTPKWVVNEMLDLIPAETWENIDATFLEPAGGNGNFVEEILRRKLTRANTTEEKIRALKSVYAIELMLDNVDEMRTRVKLIMEENGVTEGIDYIIKRNIQQGNFLSKENIFGEDISFYDWVNEGTDTLKDMIARGEQEQAEKKAKEAEQEKLLFQGSISGKGDTNRGGYDEQLKRIILGEKSDLSTIQHEFAHYWIQNNFKWARSGLASQDWLRRWRDVEEWLGIEPQDRLLSKSASEKFAKAYERYILEGKVAPELQWAFEGFQKAYQDIYEEMESEYFDLNEELAPEVVDWFNRNKEQSPKRLLDADEKKLEKALTLASGTAVMEDVAGTVVMTEPEANGDQKVYMGVKESEVPAGDNLLVHADKTTASKLQRSAKNILSDKVEVQQLATLDTQATLQNFRDWIARDRAGAWDAMMNPDTRPIYRTYLYKAFAEEALNDVDLALELANIDMAESVRELGQAIQALDIRNISGFDTVEIIRNLEKSKGTISSEELNKEVESIGLDMVELSQDEIDEVDFDTECKL